MKARQILEQLVSFPVLGGQSNLEIIRWIQTYIEAYGIHTHLLYNDDNTKASLFCRIGPAVDGGVILSGHTDVVPVEGQEWSTDPFTLTDKGDGNLYGRGSCDMKGFLACCLAMLPEMLKSSLKKPIYFAFSYDEEIGCLAAPELAAAIRDYYDEKIAFAIIGEPSMMMPTIGQKGICVLHTTVNGSAGHSSRILQEVSAVHEAARLVLWIEDYMKQLVADGKTDARFNPPHTSMHVGQINGGIAPNVIADQASFYWDVRVIPRDDIEEILAAFEAHCRKREKELSEIYPDFKIETTKHHPPVPPLDTDENDAIVGFVQELTGNRSWETVSYAAEAGQFAAAGFSSIICGPGSIAQAHRKDEYISKVQLQLGVDMIEQLIKKLS